MNNEEIRKWAKKVLDKCDQMTDKEKKMEIAMQHGFLRASIKILLEHPEDIEFVAKVELEKEGEKK